MSEREQKAIVIAATKKIKQISGSWVVPSQTGQGAYRVDLDPASPRCSCPDYEMRHLRCKHIMAVEIVIRREQTTEETSDGKTIVTEIVTATKRVTYRQNWPAYNAAQTSEKTLFLALLHDLCKNVPEIVQGKGHPRLSLRDMIFATTFKIYSTVSARRFISDLNDAQAKGYLSKTPHFNSLFNYLALESLTPLLRELITQSSMPLKAIESDFAVDSSGFGSSKYVSWFNTKYGEQKVAQDWVKAHLMCGVKTNVVTSIEISGRFENDTKFLPDLVQTTAQHFDVQEVSADKGYSSKDNHEAIESVGAIPYIAFKKSATGKVGGVYERMYHYYCFNREEFLVKYHKRSNVESTFSMIKAKFGGNVRSKTKVAQINEVLCKVIAHNICCMIQSIFEFGIEGTFCAENTVAQEVH
jgi:transposase